MQLSEMGKTELRAACKDAKIKNYSKMSVATMRAALAALAPTAPLETAFTGPDVLPKLPGEQTEPAKDETVVNQEPKVTREVRNGVRKPIKGACADVWSKCAELHAAGTLDSKTLLAWSDEKGLNRNNTSLELSAFRRFHGIARLKKA